MAVLIIGGALGLSLCGLLLVASAWRRHSHSRIKLAGAITLWVASTGLWVDHLGWEVGIPYAIETAALLALGFILVTAERRPERLARVRQIRQEPPARFRRLRRTARVLVAGPLGLVAALGLGLLFATRAPFVEQTRLIIGGLIVPTLWAILIIYALLERRLWRSSASLASLALTSFGLTMFAVRG